MCCSLCLEGGKSTGADGCGSPDVMTSNSVQIIIMKAEAGWTAAELLSRPPAARSASFKRCVSVEMSFKRLDETVAFLTPLTLDGLLPQTKPPCLCSSPRLMLSCGSVCSVFVFVSL